MTNDKKLRRDIEIYELRHKKFQELHDHLNRRITDARSGYSSRIEWIVGPSRVGKTMLIQALSRAHPEEKISGRRHVPVLVVTIPPNITPKLLPTSVLTALGVPVPQRANTSGVIYARMLEQLRLAGTKVLIFEEASHLVEPSARLPPRAAGDWFKAVSDALDLLIILFGVPRLEQLFESNEQFAFRASKRLEFRPYDIRKVDDQAAFASCVGSYVETFNKNGWQFALPMEALIGHCYMLSGGLIGLLSRFMQELAFQMSGSTVGRIEIHDCAAAANAIKNVSRRDFQLFGGTSVTMPELYAAHVDVLEANGMDTHSIPNSHGGGQ